MTEIAGIMKSLALHLERTKDVELAFAFGSRVNGTSTEESDLDVAVYFTPLEKPFDFESDGQFPSEDPLWADLQRLAGLDLDLVVLNRAPATLGYAAFQTGIPLLMRDISLYWGYYLLASRQAEDFRSYVEEYWRIKRRSRSLSGIDRARLIRLLDFLQTEMQDYDSFGNLTGDAYRTQAALRRNAERFVENIVNASIDISKIVLAASGQRIPQTYAEALANLSLLEGFDKASAARLSDYTKLRNVLAHEYLDIRFKRIDDFLSHSRPFYQTLVDYVESKHVGRGRDE